MVEAQESSTSASTAEATPRIRASGLCKVFGGRSPKTRLEALKMARDGASRAEVTERTRCTVAIRDVSFDVGHRETFVIMGLSGCGKSTVLRCLNRLIEPTAGEVLVDGTEIGGLAPGELRELRRRKLGMVFQHFALLPHRNVLENAAYGL